MALRTSTTATSRAPIIPDSAPDINLPPRSQFTTRPAHLSDIPLMALHAKEAYWLNPVSNFIAPMASKYPEDMVRHFKQAITLHFLAPASISVVACTAGEEGKGGGGKVVGCAQFVRKGDDEDARAFVRRKGWIVRCALWLLSWYFWASFSIENRIWKDRISDAKNVKEFASWNRVDDERYWDALRFPERVNRWQTQLVVVSPEYQGRGIGKLLMSNVLQMAQGEGVPVGLTASRHGEFLYRKLGFEMLGDFYKRVGGSEDVGGGIMILYPDGWEGRRH